jgi:signal transduction histidine kinase
MLVVALGAGGTALAAFSLRTADDERISRALSQQTALATQTISAEIRRYTASLTDLAAALGAQAQIEAAEYAATTAALTSDRLPGATSVNLVVETPAARTGAVQAYWRARGVRGLTLAPAPDRTSHRFVVLAHSIDGSAPSLGRDLSPSAEAAEALTAARQTGRVTVSRTYRLLRDAALPPARQQLSFVFAAPITASSPAAADHGRFRGWLVLGLRGSDFLARTIAAVAEDNVAVTLSADGRDAVVPVARWHPPARLDTSVPARMVQIEVLQRTWWLTVAPTTAILPTTDVHRDVAAWIVGGVITLLLALLTATATTARDRALRQVDSATATLRQDIDRREAVEQQLRERENELKGFAGVVAHDLRNPLARIAGYTDFLLEDTAETLDAEHRDFLARVRGGAQQMQTLIDDLLDYAAADNQALRHVSVDLNQVVAGVVHDRTILDATVRDAVDLTDLPHVLGDPILLRQVFDNLISNALKYTRAGLTPYAGISAYPEPGGDRHRIEVRDHGIGIPADQREAIFRPFVRADNSGRYPGTGLGLAIVHRIVERHGGHIGVDDDPAGGSRFWISLPVGPTAADVVGGPLARAAGG